MRNRRDGYNGRKVLSIGTDWQAYRKKLSRATAQLHLPYLLASSDSPVSLLLVLHSAHSPSRCYLTAASSPSFTLLPLYWTVTNLPYLLVLTLSVLAVCTKKTLNQLRLRPWKVRKQDTHFAHSIHSIHTVPRSLGYFFCYYDSPIARKGTWSSRSCCADRMQHINYAPIF